ncbi:Gamma-glutamyl cyclotransferase aclK [Pseudocercospora fuligena]|uniref:gamma-glutamylcyclotransferase n=1 Tax=Pseudocercospora fuligena TaxID=685502 RepID=A0A8H6VHD9_9PEZI|nr:Gamma-glutamyl cyclotransferase aclK [Pseudocercospora fuligena]
MGPITEQKPNRVLTTAYSCQHAIRDRSTTDSQPQISQTAPRRPCSIRLASSYNDRPFDVDEFVKEAPSKDETVLYLAYGSNLCKETFRGKRGIKPLSQINVQVPELRLTFDLPGIPYVEPCFANSAKRNLEKDVIGAERRCAKDEKSPLLEDSSRRRDNWHKGMIGVVYEVTAADYAHIIATEGGGSSYKDILDYLQALQPYTPTTTKQRLGQFVFLTVWGPLIFFVIFGGKMFTGKDGQSPAWLKEFTGALFKASHLSSPREIPESQNALAPAESQQRTGSNAAVRDPKVHQTEERLQTSPAGSVATTRVEDSYKDDAPAVKASTVAADQPREPDDERLYSITPDQRHKSQPLITNAHEGSALAGTIPETQLQAQVGFATAQQDQQPDIEEPTVPITKSRGTASNLKAVAQQALSSATDVQRQDHLPKIDQAVARTSSNTSAVSRTSGNVPSATSQTSAAPTSVLRKTEEHHEMVGARAADRLRARQPNAGNTSASMSTTAAQEARPAQTKSSRTAGAPVKVSKTSAASRPGTAVRQAAAPAPRKSAESSKPRATPIPAPAPAPKSTAKTRMLAETPAVAVTKTNATAEPEAQHGGRAADKGQGGKKRQTVGPDTMQAKRANGPFRFQSEDVVGSDYDMPISSPKGKAQRKGKKQELREPPQEKTQTSIVHDSITVAGKLPKVSSSQIRAARQPAKSTEKHEKDGTQRRKAKISSDLELAKYSEADTSTGRDPVLAEELRSHKAQALHAAHFATQEREQQRKVQLSHRAVEVQDAANALDVPGSQQNPQILSEGSSSSSLPTDPMKKVLKSGSAVEAKEFKTPTALRSSPPLREHAVTDDTTGLEEQTARSHKTTIIAFDKSGPRNQGKIPMATPGAKSTRSSMPPTKDHRSAKKTSGRTNVASKRRSKQPSSTGMNTRVNKGHASNTSKNVGDALQVVLGRRVNTTSQSDVVLATRDPQNASSKDSSDEALAGKQNLNQEEDFVDMNDYDDAGDLRPSQRHPSAPERPKPKTQNNPNAASIEDTTHEEDIEDSAAVHQNDNEGRHVRETKAPRSVKDVKPTAQSKDRHATGHTPRPSQAVTESVGNAIKEAPRGYQKPQPWESKAHSLPSHASGNHESVGDAQAGSTLANRAKSRPIAHVSKQKDQPAIQNHSALESSSKKMPPPPPRIKGATTTTATRNSAASIEKTAASSRPKRGVAADLPSEQAPKRVKLSAIVEQPSQDLPREATARHPRFSPRKQARSESDALAGAQDRRLSKKSLRQASQGPQTVDIHGSPVPRDMEIAETKTVLETFSQQASTSSDRARNSQKDGNKQTPYRDDVDLSEEDPFVAPPSHQQKVMSSNTKPLPAEPEAESNAFSRVKVTEAQSRMLYGEIEAVEDIANPLDGSEERDEYNSESEESIMSAARILRNLENMHGHMKGRSKKSSKNDRPSEESPLGYAVRRARKPASPPADVRPSGIRKQRGSQPSILAGILSRSTRKPFEYTAPAAEEEDADKTLVNEERSPPGSYLQKSPHHAAIDSSSGASSEDLIEWTGLLRPHQRSFFDGLVQIAQGLTKHMVNQENATDQMLEEYHRRNLYLVQQEEKRQAKLYQDLLVMCQQKRKARNSRLLNMSKDMRGLTEDFKHDLKEYKAKRASDREYNYELEAFIDGL